MPEKSVNKQRSMTKQGFKRVRSVRRVWIVVGASEIYAVQAAPSSGSLLEKFAGCN